jgi:hypothetical protein
MYKFCAVRFIDLLPTGKLLESVECHCRLKESRMLPQRPNRVMLLLLLNLLNHQILELDF